MMGMKKLFATRFNIEYHSYHLRILILSITWNESKKIV